MGLHLPERVRKVGVLALAAPALLALSACSEQDREAWDRIAMPEGASDRSDNVIEFWQWTWLAAMIVGVLVWGLIIFVAIRYRRRSDDEIPVQTRYNLPMEILYTIAPVVVVLVFFKFVIDVQEDVTEEVDAQHTIAVVGQQWSWTFNYVEDEALDGQTSVFQVGTPAEIPTLYLPVGESVRFELSSQDVVHAFWVPAFSYKMDIIPGKLNAFTMTPEREGTYMGKCTEFCGTYHSRMLFNVEVVSPEEYADHLAELEEQGNVGIAKGGSEVITQDGLDTDTETEGGSE